MTTPRSRTMLPRRRAWLLLIGLLLAMTGLAAPAAADGPAWPGTIGLVPTTVSVSPAQGPAATRITVRGTGFDPLICQGVAVLRWRGSAARVTVPLRTDGTFNAVVRAPAGAAAGSSVRLSSRCGPGPLSLPGPRVSFRVTTPAAPVRPLPEPPKPTQPAQPTQPKPDARPAPDTTSTLKTPAAEGDSRVIKSTPVVTAQSTPAVTAPSTPENAAPSTGGGTAATAIAGGGAREAGSGVLLPARITSFVPTVEQLPLAPAVVLVAAALAGLFVVLIAFPAELFNSTLESNEEEVAAVLAGLSGLTWLSRRTAAVTRWLGVARGAGRPPMSSRSAFGAFVVLGTALTLVLAGNESAGGNWPAQLAGLMIAIAVVTVIAEVPEELMSRRFSGVGGRFHLLPAAVAIAIVCTLVSRVLQLQPAYMYGLFAGFVATGARTLTRRQEGQAVLASISVVSVAGLAAWLIWTPVHRAAYSGQPGWGAVLGDSVLFWIFVLCAEGLVFALIPLRFLDGAVLRSWRLVAWLLPQVSSAAFFLYVFVLQGESPVPNNLGLLLRAVAFFVLFGLVSIAFWAYFRWEGRPTRPREVLAQDLG